MKAIAAFVLFALAAAIFLPASGLAQAVQPGAPASPVDLGDTSIYEKSLAALTMLFVLAVLLENAFAIIFNWRVFLTYFSLRGVKTIIMIAVSLAIVVVFNIDIVASLVDAYRPGSASASGALSKFVTALILAGGSSGVHNIMHGLGYRSDRRDDELDARPPKDKAWLAVRVIPERSVGEALVKIKKIGSAATVEKAPAPIAGTIAFRRPALAELLFRSSNRYPKNGGHTLSPDVVYEVAVEGRDRNGERLTALDGEKFVFAPGAIVDLVVKL